MCTSSSMHIASNVNSSICRCPMPRRRRLGEVLLWMPCQSGWHRLKTCQAATRRAARSGCLSKPISAEASAGVMPSDIRLRMQLFRARAKQKVNFYPGSEDRTQDTQIYSLMLYQLS